VTGVPVLWLGFLLVLVNFFQLSSRCVQTSLTHTSFIENSIEAGNLLRGNDALHAMLGARTRARMQLALVTMMFTCLIARLLN